MSRDKLAIVDFHTHFVPPPWELTTTVNRSGAQKAQWEKINKKLSDKAALLEDIETGDIAARVVNIPTSLIADSEGNVPRDTYRAINDNLAEIVHSSAGKLYGLASINAFDGDAAAHEVTRAINQLKLHGLFVECAKDDLLLDCSQARPALTEAARLGVPVFIHPIDWPPLAARMARYGRLAGLFARGTINAASLIALMEGRVFDELPELRVVVTALSIGGLMLEDNFGQLASNTNVHECLRRNVFIDTLGIHPTTIRASVDLVGPENVVAGSDWPILNDGPLAERVAQSFRSAGLSDSEQQLLAGANARRLLSRR